MRWRPSRLISSLLIGLMVIPPIVLIIPLFQMAADLSQLNTYRTVIVITHRPQILAHVDRIMVMAFGTALVTSTADEVIARMRGQSRTRSLAEARQYVDHSIRKTRFLNQFPQAQCGQRSLLGRLQHDCIAASQRRSHFP